MVQDGPKKRPTLEPDPDASRVVKRIFDMAEAGSGMTDITRILNNEGISSPKGKLWGKTSIHTIFINESYTGTLVWGRHSKDNAEPVRVEKAFPAIVTKAQFSRVNKLMHSRAPKMSHPRRVGSTYLLSGLVKCKTCNRALSGQDAKSGQFAYYVRQSIMKRGKDACDTPRLNARRFEELVVDKIRSNILTEGSITELVKVVDEEMDGIAQDQRKRLRIIEDELEDVKRRLGRIWNAIETSDIDMADASDRIKEHRERKERLEDAAAGCESDPLRAQGATGRREDYLRLRQGHEGLPERERIDRAQGLHRVVRQGDHRHARRRPHAIHRAYARRQPDTRQGHRKGGPERLGSVYRTRWWAIPFGTAN